MNMSDLRISNFLLKLGDYLKKNKKEDAIVTIIVSGFIFYQLGYRVGTLFSHLLN